MYPKHQILIMFVMHHYVQRLRLFRLSSAAAASSSSILICTGVRDSAAAVLALSVAVGAASADVVLASIIGLDPTEPSGVAMVISALGNVESTAADGTCEGRGTGWSGASAGVGAFLNSSRTTLTCSCASSAECGSDSEGGGCRTLQSRSSWRS